MFKLFYCTILVLLMACGDNKPTDPFAGMTKEEVSKKLDSLNVKAVGNEKELIDAFVERKKWPVIESGTGLRYIVYHEGNGKENAKIGQMATISFEISLLDGSICYNSEKDGPKEFIIEADDVESGLHEGIKYMKVGDKAKLIIPSHLAHGLLGDMNKIPPRSTIVYDVELLRLR